MILNQRRGYLVGDRANVAIQNNGKRVFFYTHGRGNELPELVRSSLARKERWDDPPYLARIIFCGLIHDDDDIKRSTGYGISSEVQDNSYPILIVDCDKQAVYLEPDDRKGFVYRPDHAIVYTFLEYVRLEPAGWPDLGYGKAEDADEP